MTAGKNKPPGFDPSAAPLDTDAEAGGHHNPSSDEGAYEDFQNAASFDVAMRRPAGERHSRRRRNWLTFVLLLAAVAALLAYL